MFKNIFRKQNTKVSITNNNSSKEAKTSVVNIFNPHKWFYVDDDSRINIKITQSLLFAFILSLCGNIFLMILIIVMLPLKQKVPTFLYFLPKEEQIVYMEDYKTTKKGETRIKEFLARDYVKKRETIDLVTEDKRYAMVYYLSSPGVASEFVKEYNKDKNPLSPYKLAVDTKVVRSIRIISSSVLNSNQIQVEFEAISTKKNTGKVVLTEILLSIIKFSKDSKRYKGNDYLRNPFGYVVSDYSLSVKESRGSSVKPKDFHISNYKRKK